VYNIDNTYNINNTYLLFKNNKLCEFIKQKLIIHDFKIIDKDNSFYDIYNYHYKYKLIVNKLKYETMSSILNSIFNKYKATQKNSHKIIFYDNNVNNNDDDSNNSNVTPYNSNVTPYNSNVTPYNSNVTPYNSNVKT
jgi:hypothetical protein